MRAIFVGLTVAAIGQQLLVAHPNSVTIAEAGDERIIKSNGIPDHQTGRFPNRNNPNTIAPQSFQFRMTLDPRENVRVRDSRLSRVKSSDRVKEARREGGPGGRHDGTFTADYEYVAGLGDLDEANGRFGVTPDFPDGIYHYDLTDEFPQIPRMFRGEPE